MELRRYLRILQRHKWLLVQTTLVVAIVAGVLSSIRTPIYSSSARVLLRPNDASEQLYPGSNGAGSLFSDPDRYVAAQQDIIGSEAVAKEATKTLKSLSAGEIQAMASSSQAGASDLIDISGTSTDPVQARDVANAVAKAYIENRRQFAVANLEKAAKELDVKLAALLNRIAELDHQIANSPGAGQGTATPAGSGSPAPANPNGAFTGQVQSPNGGANGGLGGQPTTNEGLKAARYSAALQYESLYARQQELLVDASLKRGEAEIVSLASTPVAPISPKPRRDGILGGFVGLLLGLGFAFLREQLDDRIRTREDVDAALGLPVLAELPLDDDSTDHPELVAAHSRPRGALAESVRTLRTTIGFLGVDAPVRSLLVTSPGPQDGKSLVSANLGATYAQAGFRTVLVSADLRRPRLDSIFGITPTAQGGLTEVIAGIDGSGSAGLAPSALAAGGETARSTAARVEAGLVETDIDNLFILPAGVTPPNASELLGSRRAGEVLQALNAFADVVIIDTPPVLAVTDAAVLADKVDGVVLVVSLGATHKGAASRAKEMLTGPKIRILGAVLNKVTAESSTYYQAYSGYYGDAASVAKAAPAPANGNGNGKAATTEKPAKKGLLRRGAK